jgi:hypothetical protein
VTAHEPFSRRLRDHLVGEISLRGRHEDVITGIELVDPVERGSVGGAMAGNRGVAALPGIGVL